MPNPAGQQNEGANARLILYMVVDDPGMAKYICEIDDIWPFVDLEYIGKARRQSHLNSWQSHHVAEDVSRIREAVPEAHLLVRVNPLHEGSAHEVDDVIAGGADAIMLPMFHDVDTLARFYDLLNGRAEAVPLFETAGAVRALPDAIGRLPVDALHVGLNDLHLDLGLTFMFECISEGYLEEAAAAMRTAGTRFGIGGIAQVGKGTLSAEHILGEHVRLGSTATILSRTFHGLSTTREDLVANVNFAGEVEKLRAVFASFRQMRSEVLEQNRREMARKTRDIVCAITDSRKQ